MTARRRWSRFAAAALALTLVLGTVPAVGEDSEPVVATGVTVAGVPLSGMTAAQAHEAIAATCTTATLAPLAIDATGTPFTFDVANAAVLDADAMVVEALAATSTVEIAPRWGVAPARITAFVAVVAKAIKRAAVDAKRTIMKSRLKVVAERSGKALDTTGSVTAVTAALTAEFAAGGSAQATVTAPALPVKPKITRANIGKTILVVLHERKVYLYKNTKIEKSYRCAIGMRAHPTPKGLFKVIAKNPHPSWHNPGSAWAKGMPKVIGPGYYNPLGLRALYINSPGIRIHGTAKTWSMGQAASHGCIRLTNKNVVDIYPRVKVGTPVYILK